MTLGGNRFLSLDKLIWFTGGVWLISVTLFIILVLLSSGKEVFDNLTAYSFVIDILVGIFSFGMFVLLVVINIVREKRQTPHKRSVKNFILDTIKILWLAAILPIYLLNKQLGLKTILEKIKDRSIRFNHFKPTSFRVFASKIPVFLGIIFILLPIWVAGYLVLGTIIAQQLGYISEPIYISGTGSMYPTFPKGETKTPQEQSKEIVGTPGMIRYPNGLVLFGQRIFGHKLERGDIVVVENDKIKELTKQLTGEETGWVKRIVALEGDEMELRDGIFYLNGEPQKEQYIARPRSTFGETFLKECTKTKIPDEHVFVMGDNRTGSGDSREIGFIEESSIDHVLPLNKQKRTFDKNWRDTSKDLDDSVKINLDIDKFIELLNEKRKEAGVGLLKHQTKLDQSATKRGETILKYGDFSYEATKSGYTQSKAMSESGYSNIVWNEGIIQGHYEAGELIDYLYEFPDWKKNLLHGKDFQEIGVAEVEGNLNGCPSQVIVQHFAGYVPPNYKKEDIESWKSNLDTLREIQPSWQNLKNYPDFYQKNKNDIDRINEIISIRISNISTIVARMKANQWLNVSEQKMADQDLALFNEQDSLANKLNSQ